MGIFGSGRPWTLRLQSRDTGGLCTCAETRATGVRVPLRIIFEQLSMKIGRVMLIGFIWLKTGTRAEES
jgi:hypothetical protein